MCKKIIRFYRGISAKSLQREEGKIKKKKKQEKRRAEKEKKYDALYALQRDTLTSSLQ